MTLPSVEERLQRLEDERAIVDTLYSYGHALDYGLREVWTNCWTERAVLHWPGVSFDGRAAIVQAFDDHTHAPDRFHKHVLVEPRVSLSGDTAVVDSYFARLDAGDDGPVLRSFGRYRDRVVRCDDGRWRIAERLTERESVIRGALSPPR
jgi:ketosteroid isomerase-like protein